MANSKMDFCHQTEDNLRIIWLTAFASASAASIGETEYQRLVHAKTIADRAVEDFSASKGL